MAVDGEFTAGNNKEASVVKIDSNDKVSQKKKLEMESEVIKCEICSCEMSSDVVLTSHINGSRHRKRMKALEIVAHLKAAGEIGIELGPEDSPNAYRCEICSLSVNSPQQLEIHLSGQKHKSKAGKDRVISIPSLSIISTKSKGPERHHDIIPASSPPKKKKKDDKSVACEVCNVVLNSEVQYDQHVVSRKHLNRAKQQNQQYRRANKMMEMSASYMSGMPIGNVGNRYHSEPESNHYNHRNLQANSNRLFQAHSQRNNRQSYKPYHQPSSDSVRTSPMMKNYFPVKSYSNNRNYSNNFGGFNDVANPHFNKGGIHGFNGISAYPLMQAPAP